MRRIYPWEEWFRCRRITLLRGVHYQCSQSTMSQIIRNNASARGLHISIEDLGTGFIVEVVGSDEVPRTSYAPFTGELSDELAPDDAN